MPERNLAEIFLTAARHDSLAYAKLASDPELHDSLAGFHAQQAIEKAIKAVLAHARIRFRRTHDIAELMDVLQMPAWPLHPLRTGWTSSIPMRSRPATG